MRTIKFRGKSLKTGEWVYGSYVNTGYQPMIIDGLALSEHIHVVDPETIGQYAELKDIDDTELYEDDIICDRDKYYCAKFDIIRGLKFYDSKGYYVMPIRPISQKQLFKIVGNKWDNPGLLKEVQ